MSKGNRTAKGRPPTGRRPRSFRLTDEEYQNVKNFIRILKVLHK